jgi:integrase
MSFEWAVNRADIANFKFHDLRHTFASYLAMNGATLTEIAEILDHKTLAMVKGIHICRKHIQQEW